MEDNIIGAKQGTIHIQGTEPNIRVQHKDLKILWLWEVLEILRCRLVGADSRLNALDQRIAKLEEQAADWEGKLTVASVALDNATNPPAQYGSSSSGRECSDTDAVRQAKIEVLERVLKLHTNSAKVTYHELIMAELDSLKGADTSGNPEKG